MWYLMAICFCRSDLLTWRAVTGLRVGRHWSESRLPQVRCIFRSLSAKKLFRRNFVAIRCWARVVACLYCASALSTRSRCALPVFTLAFSHAIAPSGTLHQCDNMESASSAPAATFPYLQLVLGTTVKPWSPGCVWPSMRRNRHSCIVSAKYFSLKPEVHST